MSTRKERKQLAKQLSFEDQGQPQETENSHPPPGSLSPTILDPPSSPNTTDVSDDESEESRKRKRREEKEKNSTKKAKKEKSPNVILQSSYQMKDLAGLEFKKIEDFEFGLRQLKASGVTAYSFVTYISRNDQHTIGVMLSINAEVKKLMEEANLLLKDGGTGTNNIFSGPYTFIPESIDRSLCNNS